MRKRVMRERNSERLQIDMRCRYAVSRCAKGGHARDRFAFSNARRQFPQRPRSALHCVTVTREVHGCVARSRVRQSENHHQQFARPRSKCALDGVHALLCLLSHEAYDDRLGVVRNCARIDRCTKQRRCEGRSISRDFEFMISSSRVRNS